MKNFIMRKKYKEDTIPKKYLREKSLSAKIKACDGLFFLPKYARKVILKRHRIDE